MKKEETLSQKSIWGRFAPKNLRLLVITFVPSSLLTTLLPGAAFGADAPAPVRGGFNDPAFQNIWFRSDLPVLSGQASRSLLWGAEIIRKWQEPYKESKGGVVRKIIV